MRYNADFEMTAALFLIAIAIHFFTSKRFATRLNKFFGAFIIIGLVDIASDVVSTYTISQPGRFPLWFNIGVNELLFVCQVALTPMLYVYVLSMTGQIDDKRYRRVILLTTLPAAICLLLVLINPLTQMFFYFDESLTYTHGPGFLGLYSESLFYLAASAFSIIKSRRKLRRVEVNTMLAFIAIVVGTVFIQAFLPRYLITGVALTLAIVMMYLTLQNPYDMLDSLTGAFERNSFFNYIDAEMRRRKKFLLVIFDVSDIGAINKLFGIATGDKLIAEIGAFLQHICGGGMLFRMVGDSFVLVTDSEALCESVIQKTRERFSGKWLADEAAISVGVSICYAPTASECEDAAEIKELIGFGINTLSRGKNDDFVITREMHETIKRGKEVELLLRRALDERAVEVFLQPICRLKKGRATGAEALARLRDEKGGIVAPAEFIPIAERTGLVTRMGEQVLDYCCRFLRGSGLAYDDSFESLCVNLSVIECGDEGLSERIIGAAKKYDIPPNKLCFEITETAATLSESLPERMRELSALGFRFALDDFGTGYANYDSVMRLPFSVAKFDKSMLDMCVDEKGAQILFGTIDMLSALGLSAVVEGVETDEQADMLKRRGVDYVQGFYFARPTPASEFCALFENLRSIEA